MEAYMEWAKRKNIKFDAIEIKATDDGLGIFARRKIRINELILAIPIDAVYSLEDVRGEVMQMQKDVSANALLALDLIDNGPDRLQEWRAATFSAIDDLAEILPFSWPSEMQQLLPQAALNRLEMQKDKFERDWKVILGKMPTLPSKVFLDTWMFVNSRTFYFESSTNNLYNSLEHDDRLALVPIADCFNHADIGSSCSYSDSCYEFRAHKDLCEGQEIFTSYGMHTNDFLLVEYGFILTENIWDEVMLDAAILPLLSEPMKDDLERAGYLGSYYLHKSAVCYRTEVVINYLILPKDEWHILLQDPAGESANRQQKYNSVLYTIINRFLEIVSDRLTSISRLDCEYARQKDLLSKRWQQIRSLAHELVLE